MSVSVFTSKQARRHWGRDDRGTKVQLRYLEAGRRARLSPDPREHDRLVACHRRVRRNGRTLRIVVACFFFALAVFAAAIVLGAVGNGSPFGITPVVGMAGLGLGVLLGPFGYNARRIVAGLLAERTCPSCLGLLGGGEGEEDGWVTWGACGGGWGMGGEA